MNCPSCVGSQTLRTELMYQNGLQHGSGKSASLGIGLIGGGIGVGLVGGHGPTENISDAARSLAPPNAPRKPFYLSLWFLIIVLWIVPSFVAAALISPFQTDSFAPPLFFVVLVAGWIGCIVLYCKKNADWNPADDKHALWQREWYCTQCGHRWVPETENISNN